MKIIINPLLIVAVIIFSTMTTVVILKFTPQPVFAAANMSPGVKYTVLYVTCSSVASFTSEYTKIKDFGTFQVSSPDSVVEVTFYGRVSAETLTDTSGAVFEVRVDNLPTTMGWARASIHAGEYGFSGDPVSMSGVFTGLSSGSHTVSIWVQAGNDGSGTAGRIDPGCWYTNHIVVRETLPFGSTYLPTIVK